MRTVSLALILTVAVIGAGCSKGSDSSSSSATDAPSAAASAAASTSSSDAQTDATTKLPIYPGATSQASGSSGGQAGTVLTTADAFDKVYGWYKDHMPAGSEKAKLDAGVMSSATFRTDVNGGKGTVAVTSQGGKTTISLAQTQM